MLIPDAFKNIGEGLWHLLGQGVSQVESGKTPVPTIPFPGEHRAGSTPASASSATGSGQADALTTAAESYFQSQGQSPEEAKASAASAVSGFTQSSALAKEHPQLFSYLQNESAGGNFSKLIDPLAVKSWYSSFIQPQLSQIAQQGQQIASDYPTVMQGEDKYLPANLKGLVDTMSQGTGKEMASLANAQAFAAQEAPSVDALNNLLQNVEAGQSTLSSEIGKAIADQIIGSGSAQIPGLNVGNPLAAAGLASTGGIPSLLGGGSSPAQTQALQGTSLLNKLLQGANSPGASTAYG